MGWQSCTDKHSFSGAILDALAKEYGFDLKTPYQDLPAEIRHMLIHGADGPAWSKVSLQRPEGRGRLRCGFRGADPEHGDNATGRQASEAMKQEYESVYADHAL